MRNNRNPKMTLSMSFVDSTTFFNDLGKITNEYSFTAHTPI